MGKTGAWGRVVVSALLVTAAVGLSARGDLVINEFLAVNNSYTNPLGDKSDWIEIRNTGPASVNLAGWYLTDDPTRLTKWAFPSVTLAANAYRLVFADGDYAHALVGGHLYADFALSGAGEYLALVGPTLSPVHAYAPAFPPQSADVSYGIAPGGTLQFFSPPTPGAANDSGLLGDVAEPRCLPGRGFHTNAVSVQISLETSGASIYYTTDASLPSASNGTLYTGPLTLTNSTVLRVVGFRNGYRPSAAVTHTYLFAADIIRQSPAGETPPGFPTGPVNSQILDYGMDPDVVNAPAYAPQMVPALLAIPTMSLVTPASNLFHSTSGIYVNAMEDGSTWERPASLELINPDGEPGFAIDCGVRIRGGSSREPDNPKHAFRFFFDSQYGASQLEYPLFGDEGADTFSKVDLRAEQNYSWSYARDGNANAMVREIFARDLQGQTGQPYARGRYYHLFINGHYWGIYQTDERKEANFGETYMGGNRADYDCVKTDKIGWPLHVVPTDGNMDAYQRLQNLYLAGFPDNATYYRAQGMNPDGSRNPAYERLVDVDNLIAYMLTVFFTADKDAPVTIFANNEGPNNFFALYNRVNPDGWKFVRHDAEHSLDKGSPDRTGPFGTNLASQLRYFTPQVLHQSLMVNPDYRLRFADQVHRLCFNGGAMAPTNAVALIQERIRQIDLAIVAESARWGDSKSAVPKTRINDWLPLVNFLTGTWLPVRTTVLLDQLRADDLYPSVAAPVFQINGTNQHGGRIAVGDVLDITGTGTRYYTLDGSDPRDGLTGNPAGTSYVGGVPLTRATVVKSRVRDGGTWSALAEAVFAPDEASPLRITEIMYHPRDPRSGTSETNFTGSDFEFIELLNTGTQTVGLAGMALTRGVQFAFAAGAVATLAPQEYVVVVSHLEAFKSRYPHWAGLKIAGAYTGKFNAPRGALSNSGEAVALRDAFGREVLEFDYEDDWYPCTDGEGFSLTRRDPFTDPSSWDRQEGWRHSARVDGSPGADDGSELVYPPGSVVINELLSHQDVEPPGDWIELRNMTANPINIGGWYLSDSANRLQRYRIPNGTWITNTLVFTEFQHFGTNALAAGTNGFALSEFGEGVYLSAGSGGTLAEPAYRETQEFGAAALGVTFGRWPRSDGGVDFPALATPTPNAPNSAPLVGPVVISEIMYHPLPGAPEYLELINTTGAPVPLFDPATPANTWRVDGIGFQFAPNVTVPVAARLWLVEASVPPTAFRAAHGLPPEALVFNYDGSLDNGGETITLERPGSPEPGTGYVPYIVVDRVKYRDVAPWPLAADGRGVSLRRVSPSAYGNDPASWNTGAAFMDLRVSDGHDDVEQRPERGNTMLRNNTTLVLGHSDRVAAGLRFAHVNIPQGAIVSNATLLFTAAETNSAVLTLLIRAEAADTAAAFTETPGNLSQRATTIAQVSWTPAAWTAADANGAAQCSPNLAGVIQEVVSRPGWTAGNALVLILQYAGGGTRSAWSFEGRAADAPALLISYVATETTTSTTSTSSTTTTSSSSTSTSTSTNTTTIPGTTSTTTTSTTSSTTTAGTDPVVVTLVTAGSIWSYRDTGVDLGSVWRQPGFDDSAWLTGPAQLGYGDGDEATVIGYGPDANNRYMTTYFRRAFTIADPARVQALTLHLLRDDGAVVYLNGTEVWRDNMPDGGVGFQTPAAVGIGLPQEDTVYTNTISSAWLVSGENLIAVEVHQAAPTSSDLSFDLELRAMVASTPGPRDEDEDQLPDVWEEHHFQGNTSGLPEDDGDGDGADSRAEYIAGTDPTNTHAVFELRLDIAGGILRAEFPGIDTAGKVGYQDLTRYYTLEVTTNLPPGPWVPVSGHERMPGQDTMIVYTNAIPAGPRGYRAKAWLE